MSRKMMLIINPVAGKGTFKESIGSALQILSDGGYTVTVFFTKSPGDASRIAYEHGSEYDVLSCIGGDGTLSDVLAGLMKLDKKPDVGYFPMGTTNDIATTLDLPKWDIISAAKRIVNGTPHPFDVGGFGDDRYFSYVAAFGAFTEVSYATPQNQKKVLGHLAYVLQGMTLLPTIEPIYTRVEYDDGCFEGKLLYGSMSNSTSVAGLIKFTDELVSLGDGQSELVLVKDPGSLGELGEILDSVISQRFDSKNLLILHTKKARFMFDKPVAWTRDGEAGGSYTDITLYNYKCPVRLIF